jgi:hypothetical protein
MVSWAIRFAIAPYALAAFPNRPTMKRGIVPPIRARWLSRRQAGRRMWKWLRHDVDLHGIKLDNRRVPFIRQTND